jgi:cold shock CspA family protein
MSYGAQTGVRTEGKDNGKSVVVAAATAVASTEAAGFLEAGVPETKAKGDLGDTLDNGGGGNDGGSKRLKGEVKAWNMERGFGFIKPTNGGEDVFCHFSFITDGNVLREGDMVEYEAEYDDRKGKHSQRNRAIKVTGGKKAERS